MPSVLKRPAAAAVKGPEAKKAKPAAAKPKPAPVKAKPPPQPKRDPLLVKVVAGLELAQDLPVSAKEMLRDMLDFSLTAYKEDRHPYQQNVVELVENTLVGIEKGMESALNDAQEGVKQSDEKKESCATVVQESEAKLVEQSAEVKKKKYELADAAKAFRATREAVNNVKQGQEEAERELKKAEGNKEQLEVALTEYFRPLLAAGVAAGDETGQEKVDALTRILSKFKIDESMMSALPTVLVKEPSVRGAFDTMVLSQLDTEVTKRIAAYDATLKEAEPAKAERAANLEQAEAAFAEAKKSQLDCAEVFEEAQKAEQSVADSVKEAKQSVSAAGKEARRFQREAEKAERALDNFRNGPQAAFLQLRDRTAPPPEEPVAEADEAAAEHGEVAAAAEEAPAAEEAGEAAEATGE